MQLCAHAPCKAGQLRLSLFAETRVHATVRSCAYWFAHGQVCRSSAVPAKQLNPVHNAILLKRAYAYRVVTRVQYVLPVAGRGHPCRHYARRTALTARYVLGICTLAYRREAASVRARVRKAALYLKRAFICCRAQACVHAHGGQTMRGAVGVDYAQHIARKSCVRLRRVLTGNGACLRERILRSVGILKSICARGQRQLDACERYCQRAGGAK